MGDLFTTDLLNWLGDHRQWLGWCLFLIAMLESLAIAGLLVPGVVLLVAVTAMAGAWGMPLLSAMGWAFAGAVVGDLLSFTLGRLFHQDIRRLSLFQRHPQWIARGEAFFRRYGVLSIILGRFVGPIRPIIPMIAGMLDMPIGRFVLVNLASALAWAPIYVIPGYLAGHATRWQVPAYFWHQAFGLLAAVAGIAALVFFCIWKQERWSGLAATGACLIGLIALSFASPWLGVLDSTLATWIEHLTHQPYPILRLFGPLANSGFTWLLGLLLLSGLALCGGKRHCLLLGLAALFNLAAGIALQLPGEYLSMSTSLTMLICLLISCSRAFSLWVRMLWIAAALPAIIAITAGLLGNQTAALLYLLASGLTIAMACLFSLWLMERAGPLRSIPPRMIGILMLLPLLTALLSLSGLHQLQPLTDLM
ncbi:MAG: DedA family protein [Pseudomonas sp.]|nr:DedA family protein [Pseudomonas sp.]MBQ0776924.1 DedA family protein [Pseudomonas sp.]